MPCTMISVCVEQLSCLHDAQSPESEEMAKMLTSLLSGRLNRLNAALYLLQPLDRYRAPSAIARAIWEAVSRPISHPRTGRSKTKRR